MATKQQQQTQRRAEKYQQQPQRRPSLVAYSRDDRNKTSTKPTRQPWKQEQRQEEIVAERRQKTATATAGTMSSQQPKRRVLQSRQKAASDDNEWLLDWFATKSISFEQLPIASPEFLFSSSITIRTKTCLKLNAFTLDREMIPDCALLERVGDASSLPETECAALVASDAEYRKEQIWQNRWAVARGITEAAGGHVIFLSKSEVGLNMTWRMLLRRRTSEKKAIAGASKMQQANPCCIV